MKLNLKFFAGKFQHWQNRQVESESPLSDSLIMKGGNFKLDSIKVKVPVTIKAKLTEKLKTRMIGDLTKISEQMDLEIKQVNIDRQRELEQHPEQGEQIVRFFGNEISQRQRRREEAIIRRETLEKLAIGAEIVQGTLEREVELKVGDDMREVMNVEVLIEDDKIIAIRG